MINVMAEEIEVRHKIEIGNWKEIASLDRSSLDTLQVASIASLRRCNGRVLGRTLILEGSEFCKNCERDTKDVIRLIMVQFSEFVL